MPREPFDTSVPGPTPEAEGQRRRRKTMRLVMSLFAIIFGAALAIFYQDWTVNGIRAPYVGYLLIAVGVLALLGVNVFRGGPLDKRRDS